MLNEIDNIKNKLLESKARLKFKNKEEYFSFVKFINEELRCSVENTSYENGYICKSSKHSNHFLVGHEEVQQEIYDLKSILDNESAEKNLSRRQEELRKIYHEIKDKKLKKVFENENVQYLIWDIAEHHDGMQCNCEITRRIFDQVLLEKDKTLEHFILANDYEFEFFGEVE